MELFLASVKIDLGGGQPAEVSFDAGEEQERIKRAVLDHLKESLP
jgi:hypothetical protein